MPNGVYLLPDAIESIARIRVNYIVAIFEQKAEPSALAGAFFKFGVPTLVGPSIMEEPAKAGTPNALALRPP